MLERFTLELRYAANVCWRNPWVGLDIFHATAFAHSHLPNTHFSREFEFRICVIPSGTCVCECACACACICIQRWICSSWKSDFLYSIGIWMFCVHSELTHVFFCCSFVSAVFTHSRLQSHPCMLPHKSTAHMFLTLYAGQLYTSRTYIVKYSRCKLVRSFHGNGGCELQGLLSCVGSLFVWATIEQDKHFKNYIDCWFGA